MISQITGFLVEKESDSCVIEAGGVGYGMAITTPTSQGLPELGQEARLWTHLHVREDQLSLFGFASRKERDVFKILLTASGVGPKLALALLSDLAIDHLARAIVSADLASLTRVSGVGKKTAERLVVELKGKLAKFATLAGPDEMGRSGLAGFGPATEAQEQAVQALIALGANLAEARRRVEEAIRREGPSATVETLVSAAMRGHR